MGRGCAGVRPGRDRAGPGSTSGSWPRKQAFAIPDIIRTATNLVPAEVKEVRIIDIVGLDQQVDGGTHVASTRQVGGIAVVKIENKGKGKGFRRVRIQVSDHTPG